MASINLGSKTALVIAARSLAFLPILGRLANLFEIAL
jgi:hypothetical protein